MNIIADRMKWTNKARSDFGEEIAYSINKSIVYRDNSIENKNNRNNIKHPIIEVVDADTVTSLLKEKSDNICVLNFASYKHPGGGFLSGATAQEEMLCAESFLYNVLKNFHSYYEYNYLHLNSGLYTDAAIYSPNIRFIRANKTNVANVLTCASPNWSAARRMLVNKKTNTEALYNRIKFIKDILEDNNTDTAILGAWGCGVFAQDPREIASIFKEIFEKTTINKIVYAIPSSKKGDNYRAFKNVFKEVKNEI